MSTIRPPGEADKPAPFAYKSRTIAQIKARWRSDAEAEASKPRLNKPASKPAPKSVAPFDELVARSKARRLVNEGPRDNRNSELHDAYRDPERVGRMLTYLGIDDVPRALAGKSFRCVLVGREDDAMALCIPGKKDKQYGYVALEGHKQVKSGWMTLGEVLANRDHGYKMASAKLTLHPSVLGVYRALLAVQSGAYPLARKPLPLLPDALLRKLKPGSEVLYAAVLVNYFSLRLDLAHEFNRKPFEAENGMVMFAKAFRRLWVPKELSEPYASENRREEIWQLMRDVELIRDERIEQENRWPKTLYAFGRDVRRQARFDPAGLVAASLKKPA